MIFGYQIDAFAIFLCFFRGVWDSGRCPLCFHCFDHFSHDHLNREGGQRFGGHARLSAQVGLSDTLSWASVQAALVPLFSCDGGSRVTIHDDGINSTLVFF